MSYHLNAMLIQPTRVSGQKDPVIALLRELTGEDGRRARGLFFAEGEELVARAFDYGGGARSLILIDRFASSLSAQLLMERAAAAGAEVYLATEGLIAKTLDAKPTPECIAIVERKVVSLKDALAGQLPLALMVEHGENADNLGMLLRSTDAAGVTGVVLAAETVDPFARRVVRGSRGAVFTVPISIQRDAIRVIEEAKNAGLQIVATSANADRFYTGIDYTKPSLIVVGNEHVGVSDTVRELSDAVVRIPMRGRINSLNIAVAASLALYEAVRQREAGR
jgi:RNA methyltransferase, TrmH family